MTNAVFMPHVLAMNHPAIERKIAKLVAFLGFGASFDACLESVFKLGERLHVSHTLARLGVCGDRGKNRGNGARRSDT